MFTSLLQQFENTVHPPSQTYGNVLKTLHTYQPFEPPVITQINPRNLVI